ncbi:glycoside hydrolase family 43 protein [uncultured Draconibacterium sp.]|uniref:glycoside hydrolase family 43 protein n=1 Tax=uncultured Draconibacterium sp. TaxID=1573823 RepID=UPI002AA91B4D|nr:glycoside hydrolase family 43 protein [uncultured Draconibacterium sp.]
MKLIIIISLIFFFATQVAAQKSQEIFYADPTIYIQGETYYMTGTGGHRRGPTGFSVLVSKDLKTWNSPAGSTNGVYMIMTKGNQAFGERGFWAPQILKVEDTYYLSYTANEQTVLTQSKSLLGPYTQDQVAPIDGSEKNIDSFIFKDEDGKYYLYHVRFNQGNYLWVAEFDMETGKIKSETLKKCFDQTEAWEATPNFESAPIMEGPTVFKLKDKYYLFYSANHFQNVDYAVGYAVADSPFGPWIKQKNSPIIHRSIVNENGSGHGDFFEGPNGQLYYVYHVHYSKHEVNPRRTRIVPVAKEWDADAGLHKFSVEEDKIIVPLVSEK